MSILSSIHRKVADNKTQLAYLIDPDKYQGDRIHKAIDMIGETMPDIIMIGGSLVSNALDPIIEQIKNKTDIPVVIYPGSLLQLSAKADGILFISLISGRNPEFLIGNHVVAAPILKQTGIEVIPTGYILVDGGTKTSVEYMSNTQPIPQSKTDIAVATALAGELLGMKMIYMDAGSGAMKPISPEMIRKVKQSLNIPLIVGGGLSTSEKVKAAKDAGADMLVIGNAIEKDLNLLKEFAAIIR